MIFSYYLLKFPYKLIWNITDLFRSKKQIVFFCGDYLDYVVFKNIYKYLPDVMIVAKNKKVQNELRYHKIDSILWPVFPNVVIMARHSLHKFPCNKIKKIGMRHGAYHFKKFISPAKYNHFDLFLFTSENELKQAQELGIKCGASGGFPKLDNAFNGTYNKTDLKRFKKKLGLDLNKKTLLFTATWDKSEMSAVDKWIYNVDSLNSEYNVLITLHPFMRKKYKRKKSFFIDDKNILLYLLISDIIVGDTSSILAEACALYKPIITFKVHEAKRLTEKIKTLISEISLQIESFSEIDDNIKRIQKDPKLMYKKQKKWNSIMFDELDGKNGKKAAEIIKKFIRNNQY